MSGQLADLAAAGAARAAAAAAMMGKLEEDMCRATQLLLLPAGK